MLSYSSVFNFSYLLLSTGVRKILQTCDIRCQSQCSWWECTFWSQPYVISHVNFISKVNGSTDCHHVLFLDCRVAEAREPCTFLSHTCWYSPDMEWLFSVPGVQHSFLDSHSPSSSRFVSPHSTLGLSFSESHIFLLLDLFALFDGTHLLYLLFFF